MDLPLQCSRYLARHPLGDGRWLLCHVSGLRRYVVREEVLNYIESYANSKTPAARQAGLERELRGGLILQAPGWSEETAYRKIFATQFKHSLVPESPIIARSAAQLPPALGGSFGDDELVLSGSLSCMKLTRGDLLVTHPLSRRTHLLDDLWQIAVRFATPRKVSDVFPEFSGRPRSRPVWRCM